MTERELTPPVRAAADEEHALLASAIVVRRDDRRRWLISGPKAMDVLNGLVTNDVSALQPGTGCYAAALTPKGKVIADLRVLSLGEMFLADTVGAAAPGLADMLRKYVNPRLARVEDVTAETLDLGVAGPHASRVIERALNVTRLRQLAPHAHVDAPMAGRVHVVIRTPELEGDAFDVIVPAEEHARAYGLLTEAGTVPAAASTWEVARIARGWPMWGKDMDANTLAQEAGLDRFDAISYNKGCYTGQETVARVHFRGHVNRYLRRARFEPHDEIPRGAELLDDGRIIGDVRSSAVMDGDGVAIAMVRREVAAPATLRVHWSGSAAEIAVVD